MSRKVSLDYPFVSLIANSICPNEPVKPMQPAKSPNLMLDRGWLCLFQQIKELRQVSRIAARCFSAGREPDFLNFHLGFRQQFLAVFL